ncbi:MAG: HAMP domain-containing sensor histidine kinase [Chloroflexota bacterium]
MSLRMRLAAAFAAVALITAAAVALATPVILGRGFAQVLGDATGGQGAGAGHGMGLGAGMHAQQVQQDTVLTMILVAIVAAVVASLVGIVLAGRIAEPLARLRVAAVAVAQGDLQRRSGLADRSDEIGSLGRSFDTMASELEEDAALRKRFFQDVVHELKTPLAVIDATATAVLDGVYTHEDRHLETIRAQSRLLARIVDDLRTISLAEAGQLPLRLSMVDVSRTAVALAQAFGARAQEAGVRIVVAVTPGLVVGADPDRLHQVLAALADNAIRHAPPDSDVVLESGPSGAGRVRLAVRDAGPGVAAADRPHVFDRFYQADVSRDRSAGTSGLGLSIVKALVEAQGGTVGVEDATPHGAVFWLELPAGGATEGP